MEAREVLSGIAPLDKVIQGLRLGDNVVWQVDKLEDYQFFARPFAKQAMADKRDLVYLRFAPHPPVLEPRPEMTIVELDPAVGFDMFSRAVHDVVEEHGKGAFYVFDNLSALVVEWATDESLANFFQVTCPYLFEMDTVTYFALTRGRHSHSAVARIRETTQLLVDVYHVKEHMYIHPLKVWDRYSQQMFLPHLVSQLRWAPVFDSGGAVEVSLAARRSPLETEAASIAPWDSVYRRVMHFAEERLARPEDDPELMALKQELCRMLIGQHPQFTELADKFFTLEDLINVRERLVGSGRIGGKAAGMLVARSILEQRDGEQARDFTKALDDHDSIYIGSDVFFTFLVNNDLFRLRHELTKAGRITHEEFEEVERRFLEGEFPPAILEQFRNMLDYFGQAPIIARSSSLLEDSIGFAFAGKYRSEFCANQGDPDQRLANFLRAVKLVYASTLNPNALSYRRRRGLQDADEQMAILVQRVAGMPHGKYFFPALSGVAFSRNLYAWSDRIDPKRGMIRLVFGLGTRAVERVGGDYPRMIAVSHPGLRPEVGRRVAKYSQRQVDVLDLEQNELVTLPVREVASTAQAAQLRYIVSVVTGDHVADPISNLIDSSGDLVLTFNNLVLRTRFVEILGAMLERLETAYGQPIDMEFTATVDTQGEVRVNVLQCRPLFMPGASAKTEVQEDLPPERVVFRSTRMISGGDVKDIRYIVYIDPRKYAAVPTPEMKKTLGRLVGKLNDHPDIIEGKAVLMGPGRWGSSNIDLGVNVGYADIDNAAVLVEMAREEAGHLPDVSYGTHFFQDLVESSIIFLAVYPDDAATEFNADLFEKSPNALTELLPDAGEFAEAVKVIDVPAVRDGARVHVVADSEGRAAVAFLDEG